MGVVDVKHTQEHELTLEWESSSSNDMIADSTLALVTGIDKSPASVKRMFCVSHLLLELSPHSLLYLVVE
jgi:cleavage and polyadenylation specificity factor subunit 3